MDSVKKRYRIRITGASKQNIWYDNKIGNEYEAELVSRGMYTDGRYIVFSVNPCQFVHLIDCEIVSEKLVQTYRK